MRLLLGVILLLLSGPSVEAATIRLQDEGTTQGFPWSVNCVGTGLACTFASGLGTITLSGLAGSDAEYVTTEDHASLTADVFPSAASQVPNSSGVGAGTWTATPTLTGLTCPDCIALTTETTGNYAAGDSEAGAATNILDDLIVAADFADADWGDIAVASNVASVEDDSHAHTGATLSTVDISSDTNLTAGDALTLTDDDLDFDGGAAPSGELGGTWTSPTVDATHSGSAHHSAVTLSGTPTYITLVGQDIVRGTVALTTDTIGDYVATVADGTGIDGTAAGEGATYTPTFDATELSTLTWGSGSAFTWTFDVGAVDPTLDVATGSVVWNEGSSDVDFRWESDGDANLLVLDGSTNRWGLGTSTPSFDVGIGGNAARQIGLERHTTSDTAGNNVTVSAGGATSGATNKNGGNVILAAGTATGNGEAKIVFQTVTTNQGTGTTDRAAATQMQLDEGNHLEFLGTAPALSDCGSPPGSIVGTDMGGKVTIGGGSPQGTCTLTFDEPWTNAPACWANNETDVLVTRAVSTTTTVTLSVAFDFATDVISYGCVGRE